MKRGCPNLIQALLAPAITAWHSTVLGYYTLTSGEGPHLKMIPTVLWSVLHFDSFYQCAMNQITTTYVTIQNTVNCYRSYISGFIFLTQKKIFMTTTQTYLPNCISFSVFNLSLFWVKCILHCFVFIYN